MMPRDLRVLDHLNAYRLSLRPVLARLYFGDDLDRCQQVLSRLKHRGYIKSHQPFRETRLACYQLDGRAIREMGYPQSRSKACEGDTLDRNLAMLWWCCMGEVFRPRIEPEQVSTAMGCGPLSGAHCVQQAEGVPRFLRVSVPSAAKNKDVLYALKEQIASASADPVVEDWIAHKRYVFALLFDRKSRVTLLREAVSADTFLSGLPVRPMIRVERAPTSASINEFSHASRPEQPTN